MNKKQSNSLSELFILLIFFFNFLTIQSQWITWEKYYLYSAIQTLPTCVIQLSDGNYLTSGIQAPPGGFILKLNPNGDSIWLKYYGDTYALIESIDHNYIAGLRGYKNIIKLNHNGDTLWTRNFTEPGFDFATINYICKTNDGNYAGTGYFNSPRAFYLFKFDENGSRIWSKIFQSQYLTFLKNYSDNSFITTGEINIQNNPQIYLAKLDVSGNFIWEKNFGTSYQEYGCSVFQLNDKGFLIFGEIYYNSNLGTRIYIERTDSSGNHQWSKIIGDTLINYALYSGYSVVKDILGNYNLTGLQYGHNYNDSGKVYLLSLDSMGNRLWEKNFKNDSLDLAGTAVSLCIDSGYVIAGWGDIRNPQSRSGPNYACIIKTNKFGEVNPIGIIKYSNEIPGNFSLFHNYPNPFNPLTTINFDLNNDADIKFQAFDILGRKIFEIIEYTKAGKYSIKFDGENLSTGIYFYSLESENNKSVRKMILIK